MNREQKFKIIAEGQKFGVSETCRQYGISRTLYYRWLNRYKSGGIEGLDPVKKQFTPVNKTGRDAVESILTLVKIYPKRGPRELKFLLEEFGCHMSESAVYNVLKRHNLSTRDRRLKFSRKKPPAARAPLPDFGTMASGECWLFWATPYGKFETSGTIYEYTIFDCKSKIACSRLYQELSFENFEDLLTAVAMPVAQGLDFNIKHLCFFEDDQRNKQAFLDGVQKTLQAGGYDSAIHLLKDADVPKGVGQLREGYTRYCLTFLMPFVQSGMAFAGLKMLLQKHIRDYNLHHVFDYDGQVCSPLEYHMNATGSDMILPLWAYIDRLY